MKLLNSGRITAVLIIAVTYAVVKALILGNVIDAFLQITLTTIGVNIILAVSLNLVTGFTGQFSLGHAGFMAIGAYVCAIINMQMKSLPGFLIGVLAGAVFAAMVGILIGIPTLRLKGDYLAIATLGMAEIVRIILLNLSITKGAVGLHDIPKYVSFEWLFVFVVITVLCINNFIHSSHGRACISIREDEVAAESMGVNITKYKIIAFAIGAFFAGVAGALYASYFSVINPGMFGFLKSIDILVIVVLGGMGSTTGSVMAAVLLAVINTTLQSLTEVRMIIYSVLLVSIMIFRPQGIMGTKELGFDKLVARIGKRSEIEYR